MRERKLTLYERFLNRLGRWVEKEMDRVQDKEWAKRDKQSR